MEDLKPVNAFEWFESFDTKDNPTLIRAKETLMKLAQLIREQWTLGEPMIVWLHGRPWLGKSHLINAFEQAVNWIEWVRSHRPDSHYGFSQYQAKYKATNLIISDDLFQSSWSLEEVFEIDTFFQRIKNAEVRGLPEFLFDLYEGKKIWIVSSNFDIKAILNGVAAMDWQGRLRSRIQHLLATTWTLSLEGDDHRRLLAEIGTRFSGIFN